MKKYIAMLLTLVAIVACKVTDPPVPPVVGPPEDPKVDQFILDARGIYTVATDELQLVDTVLADKYIAGDMVKSDNTKVYGYQKQYTDTRALYEKVGLTPSYHIVEYSPTPPTLTFLGDFTSPEAGDTAIKDEATTPILPTPGIPPVVADDKFAPALTDGTYPMPNNRVFIVSGNPTTPVISEKGASLYTYVKGLSATQGIFKDTTGKKFVGIQINEVDNVLGIDLYVTDGDPDKTWDSAGKVRFTDRHLYSGIAKIFAGLGKLVGRYTIFSQGTSTLAGAVDTPVDGTAEEKAALKNSRSFRIPGVLVKQYEPNKGRVLISSDIRYGIPGDSPHNIDSVARHSDDNGKTWSPMKFIQYFDDFSHANVDETAGFNYSSVAGSASFIDPLIAEAPNGDVISYTTTFPWQAGLARGSLGRHSSDKQPFVEHNGEIYLILRPKNYRTHGTYHDIRGEVKGDDHNLSLYTHMAPVKGGAIVKKNGSASDGEWRGYSIDKYWYLFKNGKPDMSVQYDKGGHEIAFVKATKNIHTHLFYFNSPFHPTPTSYSFVARSTDGGNTWEKPVDVTWNFRGPQGWNNNPNNSGALNGKGFYGVSPGVGLTIKNGDHKGRMLVALQPATPDPCRATSVYSEDNGRTWTVGQSADLSIGTGSGQRLSESQYLEAPEGQILLLHRRGANIPYSISKDGGATWAGSSEIDVPNSANNKEGVMVGASNLWKTVYKLGSREFPMVAFSVTTDGLGVGGSRQGGKAYLGYLEKDNADQLYKIKINFSGIDTDTSTFANPANEKETYAYSSIAEMADGNLAWMYEGAGYPGGGDSKLPLNMGAYMTFDILPVITK